MDTPPLELFPVEKIVKKTFLGLTLKFDMAVLIFILYVIKFQNYFSI